MKLPLFFSIFSLFLLYACGHPPPENPYPVDQRFQTSPPNQLLFTNLRSTRYTQQEDPDNRIRRYFHKQWFAEEAQRGLGLVIVENWLFDQVYLEIVRINAPEEPVELPLLILTPSTDGESKFSLRDHQWLNQLEFCRSWEEALKQPESLYFQVRDGDRLPVFPLPEYRRYFKQVLSDFEQLTL